MGCGVSVGGGCGVMVGSVALVEAGVWVGATVGVAPASGGGVDSGAVGSSVVVGGTASQAANRSIPTVIGRNSLFIRLLSRIDAG